MMVIKIDTYKLIEPYFVDRDSIRSVAEKVIAGITYSLHESIYNEAANKLSSTRSQYLRGLNQPIFGPLRGTIVLTGSLPNMLEQGATAYDMKEGLLKSKKVKYTKNGKKFITIPFRWGTPGTVGRESFSNIIPTEIQAMLKGLKTGKTGFGGAGNTSGKGFGGSGSPNTRAGFSSLPTGKTFGSYTHKSPTNKGIQRIETKYENATQYQYMSFRRISLASDKNSWIHPGFTARNFFDLGLRNVDLDGIAANIISEELQKMGI